VSNVTDLASYRERLLTPDDRALLRIMRSTGEAAQLIAEAYPKLLDPKITNPRRRCRSTRKA
jgi:hypothetical protein